jgi:predicted 2-oxoglutarate/Fe(II)-dependent dioxygenase YbiX
MYLIPPAPLEPTRVHAGCIYEYENIWEDSKKIIAELEKEVSKQDNLFSFIPADTIDGGGQANKIRTNAHLGLSVVAQQNEWFRQLNNRFYQTLIPTVEHYRRNYMDNIPDLFHEPYNLLKYKAGTEYKAHYDGDTATRRALSPILYLNDDYTGGELEFVHFGLKIKPKSGTLYLFPASFPYAHIAHPVQTGTKYAIVTWLHDGR